MKRSINDLSDDELIRIAQEGVRKELERKRAEGKPVSYYDIETKRVYRLLSNGEKIFESDEND